MTGENKLIIFVDDDPDVLRLLRRGLNSAHGFQRSWYECPLAALQHIRANPDEIGLLVTDYRMPVMDGVELAREVRLLAPETPIFCLTGFDLGRIGEGVFDRCFGKPPEFVSLRKAIEELFIGDASNTDAAPTGLMPNPQMKARGR